VLARRPLVGLFSGLAYVRGTLESPARDRANLAPAQLSRRDGLSLRAPSILARFGKSLAVYSRMLKDLRDRRFDIAVLFPNSFKSALFALLGNIPQRVGYVTDGRGSLLTSPVKCDKEVKRLHMVFYYLNILRGLDIPNPENTPAPRLTPTPPVVARARQLLGRMPRPLWGLNPGAAFGDAKRWPAERFAKLASKLVSECGGTIVIFGAAAERQIADEVAGAAPSEKVVNLCGKTTLEELVAAIAECDVFVTNDSGPMHVAQAVGTPLVAIFGPTDFSTTGPCGKGHAIVRKKGACLSAPCFLRSCPTEHRCMKAIEVAEVFEAATGQTAAG
jgi:heptosyltransferase-2